MASETKGHIKPSSKPFSQIVDGFMIPGLFSADIFRSVLSYKPRPDDIFLATYPKCGTTWAQNILALIFRQGEPIAPHQLLSLSPYLEMTGVKAAEEMTRPGSMKVHLPFHLVPWSKKAKYIYITRNPLDCCVPYFHHMQNTAIHGFNGTFDEFFEIFISGEIDYGDYFDHLLGWYAHRNDPNVLFMSYEEMKEDIAASILKMASFIDEKLYAEPLRSDPEKLQNVIRYSSFDHMKGAFNQFMRQLISMSPVDILKSDMPPSVKETFVKIFENLKTGDHEMPKSDFVRKGIIGDWKNYFSAEQYERMMKKFEERARGTDINELFGKHMVQ